MKYGLTINQAGVIEAGLLGKVNLGQLCLLDYLAGWFFFPKARRVTVEGQQFCWVDYAHACEELPLLFNPRASLASRKNQLCRMVGALRQAGLVETAPVGRRLHFRLPPEAIALVRASGGPKRPSPKRGPTITRRHDETITPSVDDTVTPTDDGLPSAIISEPGITESETMETPPLSPLGGEEESVLAFWNSHPELPKVEQLTDGRARKLRKRLANAWWREHWRKGIERAVRSPFCTGRGPRGWVADLDWFLRPDTLARLLEGKFDSRNGCANELPVQPNRIYQDTHF